MWVGLSRLCAVMGVNIEGQRKKLKKESWATSDIMSEVAKDGKQRDVTVIDLDTLHAERLSTLHSLNFGHAPRCRNSRLFSRTSVPTRVL